MSRKRELEVTELAPSSRGMTKPSGGMEMVEESYTELAPFPRRMTRPSRVMEMIEENLENLEMVHKNPQQEEDQDQEMMEMDRENDMHMEPIEKGALEEGNEEKPKPKKRGRSFTTHPISMHVVQCIDCRKWRIVPTEEEFEALREGFNKNEWRCNKKPDCSCQDPADIEYDGSRIWVVDVPGIPKAPPKTKRQVRMRTDLSKMDIYYNVEETKTRIKDPADVDKFLRENPLYKDHMSASTFNFTPPRVVEATVSAWKATNAKAKKQDEAGTSTGHK